jgi:hypothetical protein
MQCTMPAAAAIRVHCALATWRIWMWSVICSNCSTTVPLEPQCFPDFGAGLDGTKWGLHSDQIEAGSLRPSAVHCCDQAIDKSISRLAPKPRSTWPSIARDGNGRGDKGGRGQLTRRAPLRMADSRGPRAIATSGKNAQTSVIRRGVRAGHSVCTSRLDKYPRPAH